MSDDLNQKIKKLLTEKEILKRIIFGNEDPEVVYEEFAIVPEEAFLKLEDLKKEIKELKEMVYKDELTKVLNRRGFIEKFEPLFNEALHHKKKTEPKRKFEVSGFAVIFVDGDDFKSINDNYGHDEGDRVLKEIARILSENIRDIDSVGRFGGEEFVISLLGANEIDAFNKAEDIRKKIEESIKIESDKTRKITASLGVASLDNTDADTFDELIAYADQAMYEAKSNRGKNCTVKYSELNNK